MIKSLLFHHLIILEFLSFGADLKRLVLSAELLHGSRRVIQFPP